MEKTMKRFVAVLSIAFVVFHLYTAAFGVVAGIGQKSIHLGFVLIILYASDLLKENTPLWRKVSSGIMMLCSLIGVAYITIIYEKLQYRIGITTTYDVICGGLLVLALFIATRRHLGMSLVVVTTLFMLYGYFGKYFPGFLNHPGMGLKRFINVAYLTTDGIFGTPLYSSAVYIVLYVVLGAILQETGIGDYFTDIATAMFGKMRGGPAKVAVIASGFFGSISGSVVGNVVGTGTFTIPLMKKNGFEPETAGAVEAVASTGGQIMPPIMGATAFVLAENLGVPYFAVVKAAFIPAILYYVALILAVDIYARKHDLKGMDPSELPSIKDLLKRCYLLIPLAFLVVCFAVLNLTVTRAGLYTIILTLVIAMLNKETRLTGKKIVAICESAARSAVPVAVACGMAGLISAVVMGSGLGFRISSALIDVANGNLVVLLVLTMLVSLIMGMGVPTTAAYLMLAVLVAPSLTKMGIPALSAHLFILYFGCISAVTPPVALAAYAGAGLAGCSPNKTGWRAFRLAISGFILPYLFVFNPVLLLEGAWYEVILAFVTAVVGVYCLGGALEGFAFRWPISYLGRIILTAGALALMIPGWTTDVIGLACLAVLYIERTLHEKRLQRIQA